MTEPRHPLTDKRVIYHPYNGFPLAYIKVRRGQPITDDDISPAGPQI